MPIPFFGDIGWFYESARQAFFSGQLPLTGITSSVIWLHQGPIYTYILIPVLFIFNWHPLGGVFVSCFLYLVSCVLSYWVGRTYFDRKTGQISSILFILSPLLIAYAIMPFVTSLVPTFSLLLLLLLKRRYYFRAFLILGLLYQLERISILFWPTVLWQLYYQRRTFHISDILAFLLGSLPLVLAGPIEFFGPFIYALYKLALLIKTSPINLNFYLSLLNQLLIPYLSIILLISSSLYLIIKKNKFSFWLIIPMVGLLATQTTSEAYFIQIIPFILISIAFFTSRLLTYRRQLLIFLLLYLASTLYRLSSINSPYHPFLFEKISLVKKVGFYPEKFEVQGPGQEFQSILDSYRYLFWYYYRIPTPKTSVIINEFSMLK